MKNSKDMTREEMVVEIYRIYSQLSPENKAKAKAKAVELLAKQEGQVEVHG